MDGLKNTWKFEKHVQIWINKSNQALMLLREKKLLQTINKAIGDTAVSWFNYLHSKEKENALAVWKSNEEMLDLINNFSCDLIDVLAGIITNTKNAFVKERFGIDIRN